MELGDLGTDAPRLAQEILGYLNFSSGAPDPVFLKSINELFRLIEGQADPEVPAGKTLEGVLCAHLLELAGRSDAFRQVDQAEAVLGLVFDDALPAYRQHHRDLLFHQTEERMFQPFFLGRVCEAVLQQGGPWDQIDRIVSGALAKLNDYLGYRPVAVLRTGQKIQPYAHEYVRPIPLYVREAGVGVGPYRELIEKALAILDAADSALLFQAWFDPETLDELSLDPRAYDFDHPVNKRPNYLFGQWDLGRLDNSGHSRRFVLQQVALDAMLQRVEQRGKLPRDEALFEAAAVLAGTMLMGSGVSGNRPDAHASTTTLATLVQHIAAYRDVFYEQLLSRMSGPHAERLRAEAVRSHQPFGGARQHFNQTLARRRAEQLQHVHLAQLFSRMGYTEAAAQQVRVVPVVSARMFCDLHCRLSTAHVEIEQERLEQAAALLPEIEDLLHRGIDCGALVDPWNILGFSAQYSLFPAIENSVHDHRVDELIDLVGEVFDLYVRIETEAAAVGDYRLQSTLSGGFHKLAQWWDKFASIEVGSVEGISGEETRESADLVAAALRARHEAGTAAGDIGFWQGQVERFRSAKAYALVVEALLDRRDPIAAMALLVQWLSRADEIPLVEENYTFHDLALRWMEDLWEMGPPVNEKPVNEKPVNEKPVNEKPVNEKPVNEEPAGKEPAGGEEAAPAGAADAETCWRLSQKLLDYLEANAESYWEVPRFELAGEATEEDEAEEEEAQSEESEGLFSAAYEGVTYRDSTDDGFEGEMLDGGGDPTDSELVEEAERIVARLSFLATLARLWKLAAAASISAELANPQRDAMLADWLSRAAINREALLRLLAAVHRYRIPPPRGTQEAMIEYDRRRAIKEMLLEQIIGTCVETVDAGRVVRSAAKNDLPANGYEQWEEPAEAVFRAALDGDVATIRQRWGDLIVALRDQPLLYVALARGGSPPRIVASRGLQCVLRRLLRYLPRLGLLYETTQLIETVQEMEINHPVGQGAITEFDQMFQIGCRAIIHALAVSSETWTPEADAPPESGLIECLEQTTESLLRCWLAHSRGVRLSVLEVVHDENRWSELKRFIQRYGSDLFTKSFMNVGNLRAILHEGIDAYLQAVEEEAGGESEHRLMAELDGPLPREKAVRSLGIILEAVVENYHEYIDYNSTTTQSDRGEMLYTLLDMLRLRAGYDRVAWNLQPIVLAHEVLVRCDRHEAAEIWRQAVAQRTGAIADDYLKRFARLNRKYGMRLPSIADRLGERFIRPMAIDRLQALIRPAIEQLRAGQPPVAFTQLEREIVPFTKDSSGAGFEAPAWLEALEQEAERLQFQGAEDEDALDSYFDLPQVRLSQEEALHHIEDMARKD
ncbi:MAG: hypothetical protein JXB62_02205 [Pirellulales bacterium]|nr:hypothetical protein [Pirellulales bacterium]